jgi:catechol 2,3-dioxygenase-like lactoylglutathione lyase family enzyme
MTSTAQKSRVRPAVECSGIDHVVLYVRDVARSVAFYVDVLGMKVKHKSSDYAFLRCGNQLFGLFATEGDADMGRGEELSHLAFNVPGGTSAAIKKALAEHGVKAAGRSADPDCIYFTDPDGHHLQIVSPDE